MKAKKNKPKATQKEKKRERRRKNIGTCIDEYFNSAGGRLLLWPPYLIDRSMESPILWDVFKRTLMGFESEAKAVIKEKGPGIDVSNPRDLSLIYPGEEGYDYYYHRNMAPEAASRVLLAIERVRTAVEEKQVKESMVLEVIQLTASAIKVNMANSLGLMVDGHIIVRGRRKGANAPKKLKVIEALISSQIKKNTNLSGSRLWEAFARYTSDERCKISSGMTFHISDDHKFIETTPEGIESRSISKKRFLNIFSEISKKHKA